MRSIAVRSTKVEVNVSDLKSGIYLYSISENGNSIETKKIVVKNQEEFEEMLQQKDIKISKAIVETALANLKKIIIYYIFRTIYCIIKSILLTLFDILRYGWMSDDTSAYIGEHLLWWIPDGSGSSKSSDTSFYVGYYDGKPISFLKWW